MRAYMVSYLEGGSGKNDWNAEIINKMKALCLFLESDELTTEVVAKYLVDISFKLFKDFP
jgi:hypothetical protein